MQSPAVNNPQLDPLIVSIERTQKAIYFMSGINIVLLLTFAEIVCLYRDVCHNSFNIDIPPYASHSFLPIIFLILLLTIVTYESSEFIHINYLRPLRILLILLSLIFILFTVAEFVAGMILADTDRTNTWDQLSPISKSYYNNSIDNLNLAYRINMIIVCLFQLINSVILLACGIAVWVLYSKTPTGYLPRPKYAGVHHSAISEKPLVHDPYESGRIGESMEEHKFVNENLSPQYNNESINQSGNDLHGPEESKIENIREDDIPLTQTRNPFLRKG